MRLTRGWRGRGEAPVRVGIIGCGFAATALHLPALATLPEARVVIAAETDRARRQEAAARFRIPRAVADWREVVGEPSVDAVAVCVPPAQHAEVTIAALDAAKHVLVEKPLALSLADCDRMGARAARTDRVVMVGFNMRWHRLVRRARRILEGGTLGEISLVRSAFTSGTQFEPRYTAWRAQLDGGVLLEVGIHHYDLWRLLLGSEIAEVFARTTAAAGAATVSARMQSGALADGVFSQVTGGRNEIDLFGDAAQMHLSCYRFDGLEVAGRTELYPGSVGTRLKRAGRVVRELREALPAMPRGGDFVDSYRAQWRAFLDAVRRGEPTGPSLADGRRAVLVALAAARSAATGQPVACDGVSAGDPEA